MPKKIKFPLKMANEASVRTLEELRENFNLASVLSYYDNGQLVEWLSDRYYDSEAEQIGILDVSSSSFNEKLCEILGVEYSGEISAGVDLSDIATRNERREQLKKFTSDDAILEAVGSVAFTQEELDVLLDEGIKQVYLCGDIFTISDSKKGITYIGVNNPEVDVPLGVNESEITLVNVNRDKLDELIQRAKESYILGREKYVGDNPDYIEAIENINVAKKLNYVEALNAFKHNGTLINDFQMCVSSAPGSAFFVGLKTNGIVISTDMTGNYRKHNTSLWRNIIAVTTGIHGGIVGLKNDGTIVAVNLHWQDLLKSGVDDDIAKASEWGDIVAISSGCRHVVGLKSNGTVVAVGDNECGQCNVQEWNDICSISASYDYTFGLRKNGGVVVTDASATPDDYGFSYEFDINGVKEWTDIVSISCGYTHIAGLKSDGTVVSVGKNNFGECNVEEWRNIKAISCGENITIGLKDDGTVVKTGNEFWGSDIVEEWQNIIAITAGYQNIYGLKKNGEIICCAERHDLGGLDHVGLVMCNEDFY